MLNTIIKLKKVNKIFSVKTADVWVLKNVDLQINSGEFVMIFGPSGSGKSTMLHVILGLEAPTNGDVEILGLPIYKKDENELSDYRKQFIGMIYQQPNWIKALTVVENVAFPLTLMGKSWEESMPRALKKLEEVGMEPWKDYRPTELSSGQQQKVAFARALITEPQIIVADEPTGNLDVKSGDEIIALLRKEVQKSKTVIMVSHDLTNLEKADKVIQFLEGTIVNTFDVNKSSVTEIQKKLLEGLENANLERTEIKRTNQDSNNKILLESFNFVKRLPYNILHTIRQTIRYFVKTISTSINLILFVIIQLLYKLKMPVRYVNNIKVAANKIQNRSRTEISYLDIAMLSIKNMFNRKTRTWITIGGISLGISFIVFLLSIGYGLERLVISRVATLQELKQIEATPAVNSNLIIDEEIIDTFEGFNGVSEVIPLISSASRINFQGSLTDSVVYATDKRYLEVSEIDIINGEYFEDTESNVILVNDTLVSTLGLDSTNAINQTVTLDFVLTNNQQDLVEDKEALTGFQYKIKGVVRSGSAPLIYIPSKDFKSIGLTRYSLLKVVVSDESFFNEVRQRIELSGFRTTAVVDTIVQIENFFQNFRLALLLIGAVALSVASLGMFNTMTVALLERTREVGLMKALGMRSKEVQDLFLIESIAMGFIGGVGGIIIGFIFGKLLSLGISAFSVPRGYGFIDITFLPTGLILSILLLAAIVGTLTGYIPARRATRISALNALRYE